MERAGTDEITEEVERSGLGTPATRAKEMAKALITDGKIAVKGLYSQKSGRNYDDTVCLDDTERM